MAIVNIKTMKEKTNYAHILVCFLLYNNNTDIFVNVILKKYCLYQNEQVIYIKNFQ